MATVLLSYEELGDRLQIKAESARKLAVRKRWRKVTANDGTTRVHVPEEELPAPDTAKEEQAEAIAAALYTKELETQIAGLKALVAASDARADAEARRGDAEAIARQSETRRADTEARRADAAETERDSLRAQAQRSWLRRMLG
jgi:hypothetical protein